MKLHEALILAITTATLVFAVGAVMLQAGANR